MDTALNNLFFQISSFQSAYDHFHRDNPGVGFFLVSQGEEQEGGAISLHPLKDFEALHSKGGKVQLHFPWQQRAHSPNTLILGAGHRSGAACTYV